MACLIFDTSIRCVLAKDLKDQEKSFNQLNLTTMQKLLFSVFVIIAFIACRKEDEMLPESQTPETIESRAHNSVTICHFQNGTFKVKQVNANAVPGHLSHGDLLVDADGDGYTSVDCCTGSRNDCNDNVAAIHPGATEVCDGIDNNCNGQSDEGLTSTYYQDEDGDGYGNESTTVIACSVPQGYVNQAGDCDDDNGDVNPGVTEIVGNGTDDDCDESTSDGVFTVTLSNGTDMQVYPVDNSGSINWGPYIDVPGVPNGFPATTDLNGEAYTQAIVETYGAGNYAAKLCADLDAYGNDDWYLPSYGEIVAMKQQLKDVPNSGFVDTHYWTSNEQTFSEGITINFPAPTIYVVSTTKNQLHSVRCVRK